tara:strand:- start:2572 stop:3333 length:762 start_codon:yes stop_codon:yes gene_type:complete
MGQKMEDWENRKMKNPYAGVKNPYENLENVYEDAQVNLKQAEFEKEQSQQSMANIMQSMQGAAGGSGIAGLAQVLANQGVKQAQQASVSIASQEQQNQQRAIAESGRLAEAKAMGEQKRDLMVREGERMVEAYDMKKEEQMLDFAMQRKNAADQAIADAQATVDAFVSGAVTSGINTAIKASDIRLKENITKTGVSKSGIPKYTFNYKGEDTLWSGAMAQDLISMGRSDAVTIMDNGYYGVNYDMIDIDMIKN